MRIFFICFIFFGVVNFTFSQIVDKKIDLRKKELRKSKVDTFIVYHVNCISG